MILNPSVATARLELGSFTIGTSNKLLNSGDHSRRQETPQAKRHAEVQRQDRGNIGADAVERALARDSRPAMPTSNCSPSARIAPIRATPNTCCQ